MESLRRAAIESLALSPPDTEELVGILYGPETKEGWHITLWRAIPRKSSGPAVLPLGDVEMAIAQRLLRSRGLKPIGFFRSRTIGEESLDPEEIQLGSSLFPSQQYVALILRPSNQRPVAATFFVGSGSEFKRGSGIILEEAAEMPPLPLPEKDVPLPVFLSAHHQKPRERRNWLVTIGAFLVGAAMALPVGYVLVDRPLKLDAGVTGERLTVSWNRFSGILSGATGGELEIDGRPKELTLDQLRAGGVETSAPSGDFKVRLRLRGPYAESQRAIVTMVQP